MIVVLFCTQLVMAQIDVKLSITNIKKTKGNLAIEFYRNVENYTKGQNAFKKLYVPVENIDKYETVFKDIEPTFEEAKIEMSEENNTISIKLNNNKGGE